MRMAYSSVLCMRNTQKVEYPRRICNPQVGSSSLPSSSILIQLYGVQLLYICGCRLIGEAPALQAGHCGFESRHPLQGRRRVASFLHTCSLSFHRFVAEIGVSWTSCSPQGLALSLEAAAPDRLGQYRRNAKVS